MQEGYFIFLFVFFAASVVYLLVFIHLSQKQSFSILFEKLIIVVFLITTLGVVIFPFNYLNPSALAGSDKKDWSLILQLTIYAIAIFLIRSRFRFIFQAAGNLFKAPFILLLLIFTALSATWSTTPILSLIAGIVLLFTAIFAAYVSAYYNWRGLTQLLRWAITCIGLVSIPVTLLLPSVGFSQVKGGWMGILGHPNPFGSLMALNAVLWALNGVGYPQYRRRSAILFCISFCELVLSSSSGALVNFFVLVGLFFVIRSIKHLDVRWGVVSLALLIGLSLVGSLWLSANMEFILSLIGRDVTLTGRTDFWPQVVEAILKNPVGGYGYNGFWLPWLGRDNPADGIINPGGFIPEHAHNGYLDLGLNLGILGLLLFSFSLAQALYQACLYTKRSKSPEAAVPVLFLTFLLIKNFSETGLWSLGQDSFLYILLSVRLAIDGFSRYCDQEFQPRSDF